MGEQGWDAGERMGMAGTGCVGHRKQETCGPDVARAARRMQGPEHPLHVGCQISSETRRSFPKKMGGSGEGSQLITEQGINRTNKYRAALLQGWPALVAD